MLMKSLEIIFLRECVIQFIWNELWDISKNLDNLKDKIIYLGITSSFIILHMHSYLKSYSKLPEM